MSRGFIEVVGVHALGDEEFGILELSVLDGKHAQVHIRFGSVGIDAQCLTQVGLCGLGVSLPHCQLAKVVVGSVVVGEERYGLLQDGLFLRIAGRKRVGSVDKFLDAEI